jgi:hypothetical protein
MGARYGRGVIVSTEETGTDGLEDQSTRNPPLTVTMVPRGIDLEETVSAAGGVDVKSMLPPGHNQIHCLV